MEEKLNPPVEFDAEYQANVTLSYDYLEKAIKEIQDITNNANTQLGLLIGFNFTFIRFFLSSLPDSTPEINTLAASPSLILKAIAYIASGISIICCFRGLYVGTEYFIVPPEKLISECAIRSTTALQLGIINAWQTKLKQFIQLQKEKKQLLNIAILCLIISATIAVLDYALGYL